ncbi:restin homolog isoform X2 [Drosophila guanche]|uniref:restin homolog isoform X2 n=1 Tax=Drosophila guanche TaxID=7266 RepID=UPI001470F0AA|nr:restin homolog isoform X2 [Drosophila guanche]
MSDNSPDTPAEGAAPPAEAAAMEEPELAVAASKIPGPSTRSNIPTPAASMTGTAPPASRLKAPSNFGSTSSISSVSKIGRPCCNHTTPKSGPPPRDTNSMSRESDDNLSSINSAYTDLYQETVKRFTRSSLSPTSDWERYSPAPSRRSHKSETGSRTSYDYYLEATGRRRSSDHNSAVLTANTEQFIIGQKVWVGGLRSGQIAYIGETHFAPGDWAGIVLDEPNGKNDGCVSGKRYFQCEPKRGIFSRLTRLTVYPMSGAHTPTSPLAKNSPERSRTVSPTASIRSSMMRSPGIGKNGMAVGDRVIVSSGFGSRPGILRYLGETSFAPGNWCGVELDEASGKNDGAVDGIRYFECKPKYGVFVPIAKVSLSPSSKKTRLSRAGSRESLTSIGTMNSIATTNTSRMRMNAQRKSSTPVRPIVTTPKSQFSMQDLLREKQQHVEQLMVERELDREDSQNQALQLQKNINELKLRIFQLESELGDERKKSEDLQFSIDEAQSCGEEYNAQSQVYREKIHDLESKITKLVSATTSLQSLPPQPVAPPAAAEESPLREELSQLQDKLSTQQQETEARLAEQLEEEQRLRENIKYLQEQNAVLQAELLGKDESLEKFSLSQSGIDNLRRELALLKEENEKQSQEAQANFDEKLAAKTQELSRVTGELQQLKSTSDTLESQRANVSDECEILQTEIRMRDEQIKEQGQQLDELTTQLNVQKADNCALDDMLRQQQASADERGVQLQQRLEEINEMKTAAEQRELQVREVERWQEQQKQELERQNLQQVKDLEGQHDVQVQELMRQHGKQVQELQRELANLQKLTTEEQLKQQQSLTAIEQLQLEKCSAEMRLAAQLAKLEVCHRQQNEAQSQLTETNQFQAQKELQLKETQETVSQLQLQLEQKSTAYETLLVNFSEMRKSHESSLKQKELELEEAQAQSLRNKEALETVSEELKRLQQRVADSDEEGSIQFAKLEERISELSIQARITQANLVASQAEVESKNRQLEATNAALEKINKDYAESRAEASQLEERLQLISEQLQSELQAERSSSSDLHTKLSKFSEEMASGQKELTSKADAWSQEMLQKEREMQDLRQQLHTSQEALAKLQAQAEQREAALEEAKKLLQDELSRVREELSKLLADQQQLSSGTQETIRELKERLEITNTDLQHKEKMALEDAQKISDLKTLVEAIQVANANISETNAELSTVLEVLQAEKSETNHIFELFEMEADMNAERLIEKLTGMKEELKETHQQHEERHRRCQELELQLSELQQSDEQMQSASQASTEKLRELQHAQTELQAALDQKDKLNAELETKLQESLAQLNAQRSSIGELQAQLEKDQQALSKFQADVVKSVEALQQVQQANEEMSGKLAAREQEVKDLEGKLAAADLQLDSKQSAYKELQEKVAEKLEKEQQESQASTEKLQQAQGELQKAQGELEEVKKELQKAQGDHQRASGELQGANGQLQQAKEELQKDLNNKQDEVASLQVALEETKTQLDSQSVALNALQEKLEQAQLKERSVQEEAHKSAEQLRQLQQANESMQVSLKQKQNLLEKGNEFDAQLAEYQKVIDEMDEAAKKKALELAELQPRVHELEAALHQAKEQQKTASLESKQLRRQLETIEGEKSREIVALRAQVNGASPRVLVGDNPESLDTETTAAKINFLNSIISDMQQKNDALKAKVQTLEMLPMDFTKPHAFDMLTKRKPAPRLFCDICDEFDKHETEDCPLQAGDDRDDSPPPLASERNNNEQKERKLPAPRKYCENCEAFGHDTSECEVDDTY